MANTTAKRPATGKGSGSGTKKNSNEKESLGSRFGGLVDDCVAVFKDKKLGFDLPLLVIVVALVVVGLVMMYSASYAYAYYHDGDSNYYIRSQLIFAVLGFALMFLASLVPAEKLRSATMLIVIISYALLVIVLFMPKINYVRRWINLGFTTFQPSEIAKFAVIIFGAKWGDYYYEFRRRNRRLHKNKFKNSILRFCWGIGIFILMLGTTCGLVVAEPHISCTILLLLIGATMMWMSGVDMKWFILLIGIAVAGIIFVIFSGTIGYSMTRIEVWKDPFSDIQGTGWQNVQALYAISSGGLLGQGIGNSKQKFLYISEPQNDFVFAVVCEELGFVGATLVILLFMIFVWRGFTISISNPDRFSKLMGIGITAQIGWQALLNVAVVTNTIPNTGISLPFFSYGGTSLVMLLLEIGVLLSISRKSTFKQTM
ncbi:MAG: cell division protein FtsW [Clostridia bacterium]|nr:cell division protein FtsW [Clostridia bacterium]